MKLQILTVVIVATLLAGGCTKEDLSQQVLNHSPEAATLSIETELQELDEQLDQLREAKRAKGYMDMELFEKLMEKEQKLMDDILENKDKVNSGNILYVPGDYPHPGPAIFAAQPGDVVIVEAGTYDFGEVIVEDRVDVRILADDTNGPVIIKGRFRYQNSTNVLVRGFILHPNEFQDYAFWTGGSVQDDMRIVGNTVDYNVQDGPFGEVRFRSEGVSMKGDNYFIKSNTFYVNGDVYEYGINQIGDNNLIKGNTCVHAQGPALSSGILISGNGNLVDRNDCSAGAEEGIRVDGGSSNNTVIRNTCNNNLRYGIFVAGTNTVVNDNTALNNSDCDIFAAAGDASAGSTESGNTANCIQGF